MSMKRRDNKGRILRDGELQRKDGKYEYRYTDQKGGRHSIYSWRLVETDKTPAGKRSTTALRTLSEKIQKDIANGMNVYAARENTVDDYFELLMQTKKSLQPTTLETYRYIYNKHIGPALGHRKIGTIRYSNIVDFYSRLLFNNVLRIGSIKSVNNLLTQIANLAKRDGAISLNPVEGALETIAKKNREHGRTAPKQPLSIAEQQAFLSFVRNTPKYKKWENLFVVLLGTGMRVGEVAGLTWDDIDFDNNFIRVSRAIQNIRSKSRTYAVSTPKTSSGVRLIPMLDEVRQALENERQLQSETDFKGFSLDGISNFVFATPRNNPITSVFMREIITSIVKSHNSAFPDIQLPTFSAHNLRHTFCTRLCENESNLKVIQEVMGHSNISITMNVYSKATKEKMLESFAHLNGQMSL